MNTKQNYRGVRSVLLALAALAISALALNSAGANNAAPAGALSGTAYLPLVMRSEPRYDWPQFNGDARHSGSNSREKIISPANVNRLGVLFQASLPDVADGAPVYLANVTTAAGVRDLIFVTTRSGDVVALDALTGAVVWVQLSRAAPCSINNNAGRNQACYTTASPALDPDRQYVYSYGLDGYVHKYAVSNGTEIVTGGWPELTSRKVYDEKGSSALSIATPITGTSYLYVAHGGYPGDAGNYQGHLTAINLNDGTQKVFNTLCSNQAVHFVDSRIASGPDCYPNTQSAIWARAGVVYDSDLNRLYMATGNGIFAPSQFMWGDTVFALNPDGTGTSAGDPLDSYTPVNFQSLANADQDLGSTAPGLLPPAGGKFPRLAVQGGKDAMLRLINLVNLSGGNRVGLTGGEVFSMPMPMGGGVLTQPAIWVNPADSRTWVFVSNGVGTAGLQFAVDGAGNPSLQSKWQAAGGTSPIVANGVLFSARSGLISALDPASGTLLWSNNLVGGIHWESPIAANGVLYITDENKQLTAYSLH